MYIPKEGLAFLRLCLGTCNVITKINKKGRRRGQLSSSSSSSCLSSCLSSSSASSLSRLTCSLLVVSSHLLSPRCLISPALSLLSRLTCSLLVVSSLLVVPFLPSHLSPPPPRLVSLPYRASPLLLFVSSLVVVVSSLLLGVTSSSRRCSGLLHHEFPFVLSYIVPSPNVHLEPYSGRK